LPIVRIRAYPVHKLSIPKSIGLSEKIQYVAVTAIGLKLTPGFFYTLL